MRAEVRSGSVLGLGSGSTAELMVRMVGSLLADGTLVGVQGVATSEATARLATMVGVPLVGLDQQQRLAVCIDGADEIAPGLALIKGLGGALLREKVVAAAADRLVIVADESKRVGQLGQHAPLPVEVVPFAEPVCRAALARLGCQPTRRAARDGTVFVTDSGNWIVDCAFGLISEPEALACSISAIPGVVEHGLFLGMAQAAYIASDTHVTVETPAGPTTSA